jgi:chemotaxis protein methyltransferase CheR
MNDQEYIQLRDNLNQLIKLDIDCYKSQQMRRRLDAFMSRNKCLNVSDFCRLLERDQAKQRELLDYIAINVSEFFRDTNQFKNLQNFVLPQLIRSNRRLNIWSAACSSGQEPYSIAMILEEIGTGFHRIIGTDIDETALRQAKNGGPYTDYDVRNVDKNLLDKYFIRSETGYWVDDRIKKKIIFQRLNLLSDLFYHDFDLIVCRNVIIYFSEIVRDNLIRKFYDSLKLDGILFLGGSEVILKPLVQGYAVALPSFYRKIDTNFISVKTSHQLNGVLK